MFEQLQHFFSRNTLFVVAKDDTKKHFLDYNSCKQENNAYLFKVVHYDMMIWEWRGGPQFARIMGFFLTCRVTLSVAPILSPISFADIFSTFSPLRRMILSPTRSSLALALPSSTICDDSFQMFHSVKLAQVSQ